MTEEKDNISPEEKLLKVIQSDGKKPEGAATADKPVAAATAAKPVEPVKPAQAEKPSAPAAPPAKPQSAQAVSKPEVKAEATAEPSKAKLKLAKEPEQAKGPEASKAPEEKDAPKAVPRKMPAEMSAVIPVRKQGSESFPFKIINRLLAACIMLMLGLSAMEIFGAIRANKGEPVQPGTFAVFDAGSATGGAPFVEIVEAFKEDCFDRGQKTNTEVGVQTTVVNITGWMAYVKDNWKLLGVSLREPRDISEGIILDKKENKMYFARVGESIPVPGGSVVVLEQVEGDRIKLTDHKASLVLQ